MTDITIVPKLTMKDYRSLLTNPTTERLRECSRVGEQETWKRKEERTHASAWPAFNLLSRTEMSFIRSNCEIEFTLDECVRRVRGMLILQAMQVSGRVRAQPSSGMGRYVDTFVVSVLKCTTHHIPPQSNSILDS